MNEENKDLELKLKQTIDYYTPFKQKYEDLKEDYDYIQSLLDNEFEKNIKLKRENEKLKQTIQKIADLDDLTVEELLESVKGPSDEVIMQYLRIFYD